MGKYHFIAIGGIGMSGLAKYLLQDGHTVTGSDIADSKYIDALKELGAGVNIGHNEANLPDDTDVVVVSTAIKENNPELIKAKNLGMKIYHRSDLLAEIAKSAQDRGKCFIGFSGTHGKTTTSGMASFVLDKAGLEPSFVDGGIVPELHTNAQHKSGEHFVAELDESDGTIVKYNPDILVVNNLEEDHLDFYKNGMSDLVKTFDRAISQSKKIIVNNDNEGIKLLSGEFITFGLNDADYTAKNIEYSKEGTTFEIYHKGEFLTDMFITVAGIHNVYNTLAVCAALNESGVVLECIKDSFAPFTGMGRRFEKVAENIYDDYAHHPTEIKATLEAASLKFGKENIVAVFQPHRYTRLQSLWDDFKASFDNAGRLIVTDVYAASEDPIEGVNGEQFASEINAEYIGGSIEEVAKKLKPTLKTSDIVIGLGAGTITKLGKYLAN
ncbi:MAG: UDP-N-acetylmuramate--L-alanine ligase [Candidatus Gastranaerophilales bacterium]|nr:UDP-N-acetylmuramate--L-alanine ligase [Candidatus Gastranaerophilales bacterium]MCM1073240.1 UDP-N-acetylmuramate--L-alanine ligase [Bacteroides sp.]